MADTLTFWAPIEKADEDQRMVYGYASTEAMDSQGEVVKRDALKGAIDDYMRFANIREMHQPSAVGKAKQASIDSKGLYIAAKIVDDEAWNKVKEGVYSGFSIGGRVKQMVDSQITSLALSEISLVDRPACPEAVIDVFKADMEVEKKDYSTDERKQLASDGKALPDGSYPIVTVQDLKNAIQSFGRAKNKAKVKAHIIRRAKALKREDLIPDSWKSQKADMPELRKEARDAAALASTADYLNYLIEKETEEGDEETVKALKIAQQALKDAATSELSEDEECDECETEVAMSEGAKDLKKSVEEQPEKPAEELPEAGSTTETQEEKKEETVEKPVESPENTGTEEKTEEVTTSEEKPAEETPTETVEETKETAAQPTDLEKTVDEKIARGEMPTKEEMIALLKASGIEANHQVIEVMKFELAGKIIEHIEKDMGAQANKDVALIEAKKVLDKAEMVITDKPNQFDHVLKLVEKLEKSLSEAEGSETEEKVEEKAVEKAETPIETQKVEDSGEIKKLESEVSLLKKQMNQLLQQPLPIKAYAGYAVVEKKFAEGDGSTAQEELQKCEKRSEELQAVLKSGSNDKAILDEAASLSVRIMQLRREAHAQR